MRMRVEERLGCLSERLLNLEVSYPVVITTWMAFEFWILD